MTKFDPTYITCGEYQLFIDEKATLGEFYQPDPGRYCGILTPIARQAITGGHASDAEAFCRWLTDRYLQPGLRYRLPTILESAVSVHFN